MNSDNLILTDRCSITTQDAWGQGRRRMMQQNVSQRLARLRGSLRAEAPGARGLERVARNPACQRLLAITSAGLTPAGIVKQVYREDPREGQSPFAIGAGNQFERELYDEDA